MGVDKASMVCEPASSTGITIGKPVIKGNVAAVFVMLNGSKPKPVTLSLKMVKNGKNWQTDAFSFQAADAKK